MDYENKLVTQLAYSFLTQVTKMLFCNQLCVILHLVTKKKKCNFRRKMKILVTGASGYIGFEVTKELLNNGHQVVGMTTSQAGVTKLEEIGAEPFIAKLDELQLISNKCSEVDGVIHLAFVHDFANHQNSIDIDYKVVEAIGNALVNSNKPLITTAHVMGESVNELVMEFAQKGVRASVASLAPSVHGDGDKAFVPTLINISKQLGYIGYVGTGENMWPAIHRKDAARLFRLAVESCPAGNMLEGKGEDGIKFIDIATAISKAHNLELKELSQDDAIAAYGQLGMLMAQNLYTSSASTRELLGWEPKYPTLIEDINSGLYN